MGEVTGHRLQLDVRTNFLTTRVHPYQPASVGLRSPTLRLCESELEDLLSRIREGGFLHWGGEGGTDGLRLLWKAAFLYFFPFLGQTCSILVPPML